MTKLSKQDKRQAKIERQQTKPTTTTTNNTSTDKQLCNICKVNQAQYNNTHNTWLCNQPYCLDTYLNYKSETTNTKKQPDQKQRPNPLYQLRENETYFDWYLRTFPSSQLNPQQLQQLYQQQQGLCAILKNELILSPGNVRSPCLKYNKGKPWLPLYELVSDVFSDEGDDIIEAIYEQLKTESRRPKLLLDDEYTDVPAAPQDPKFSDQTPVNLQDFVLIPESSI